MPADRLSNQQTDFKTGRQADRESEMHADNKAAVKIVGSCLQLCRQGHLPHLGNIQIIEDGRQDDLCKPGLKERPCNGQVASKWQKGSNLPGM
jgi:hypothetical protein